MDDALSSRVRDALASGELSELVALMTEDVVVEPLSAEGERIVGLDKVSAWADQLAATATLRVSVHQIEQIGEHGLLLGGRMWLHATGSGVRDTAVSWAVAEREGALEYVAAHTSEEGARTALEAWFERA